MRYFFLYLFFWAAACTEAPSGGGQKSLTADGRKQAQLNFLVVLRQMEPTIESACRARLGPKNCDFKIVVDNKISNRPNAFQTILPDGTPLLGFTEALIYDVQNRDEMAFVMGHEAAHHILSHLSRQKAIAERAARDFEAQARSVGASEEEVKAARAAGTATGRVTFSREFEIEADVLGAKLTQRAGFDALRGSAYFQRIPVSKNAFLSTHPPNAARVAAVRRSLGL